MAKKKNKRIVKAPKTEEKKLQEREALETEIVEPDKPETNSKAEKTEAKKQEKVSGKEKAEKNDKADKNKKQKSKKEKGPNVVVKKTKETFSELKKVSWPSFKTVVKNTGVVIVVVLLFTVVLFGIDRGLAALYNLIPR